MNLFNILMNIVKDPCNQEEIGKMYQRISFVEIAIL